LSLSVLLVGLLNAYLKVVTLTVLLMKQIPYKNKMY